MKKIHEEFDERDKLIKEVILSNYAFSAIVCLVLSMVEKLKLMDFSEKTTRPLIFMLAMSLFCILIFSKKRSEHFRVSKKYYLNFKEVGVVKMSAVLIGFAFVLIIVPYLVIFFPGNVGRVAYAHKAMTESIFSLWAFGPIMSVSFYIGLIIIFVLLPIIYE